ncbi:hypothetical protein Tco_0634794, partial [Tanacetum coccineum]
ALRTSRGDNHTHPEINPFFTGETSSSASSERRAPHNHHLKLQFPKFDGKDPTGFIFEAEQYFQFQNVGAALAFRTNQLRSEALSHLRQTLDLEIYIESFKNLSHRVDGLPEGFLIGSFIARLQDDICWDVKIKRHHTLAETIGVSRLVNERNKLLRKTSQLVRSSSTVSVPKSNPSPSTKYLRATVTTGNFRNFK